MDPDPAVTIEAVDAGHRDAVVAVDGYLAELTATGVVESQPPADDPDDVARLNPPTGRFLVARDGDGVVVGCGGVRTIGSGVGEIKRMWVDAGCRGSGLGRRLLAALEDAARDLGHHTVRLDTSRRLTVAIGMYRSAGYVEIAAYNDNPDAELYFEKRL